MLKNPPANVGEVGSIPGSGISPGEGNGNPCQYSCLENSMDRGAWWATVHGVAKSRTWLKQLNNSINFTLLCCAVLCLVAQMHLTGVGCHALLQGIFPTQGSNPGLLHCRCILYHLSYQGSPPGLKEDDNSALSLGSNQYDLNRRVEGTEGRSLGKKENRLVNQHVWTWKILLVFERSLTTFRKS